MYKHGNILLDTDRKIIIINIGDIHVGKTFKGIRVLSQQKYDTGTLLLLPWNEHTCGVLFNYGYQEALECTPFMYDIRPKIEGKYVPFRHQEITASFITLFPRSYVLSEPRLGKTGSLILAIDYLQRHNKIKCGVCIITTYTTIHGVWEYSFKTTLPDRKVSIIHGLTRKKNLSTPADVYITNYDSVRLELNYFLKAIDDKLIDAIVVDELTHVGNEETKRSNAIRILCNHKYIRYVIGMTGSPGDNPDAVFGMALCINPRKLRYKTKESWQKHIYYYYGIHAWQRRLLPTAWKTIANTMLPAIRYKKADVLDLPPITEQIRECVLSKDQEQAILELQNEARTMLQNGEIITAANAAVLVHRLMQIALGIIKAPDGQVVAIPHKERTQVLLEAVAETPRKTVVFCPYVAGCAMLAEELRSAGYTTEIITGSVSGSRRTQILYDFQNSKDPHILVCHPGTVGFGTELSAADTMIFAIPMLLGVFVYTQSLERLSSVKQKSENINIIHIIGCKYERKVLVNLKMGYLEGKNIASTFEYFTSQLINNELNY